MIAVQIPVTSAYKTHSVELKNTRKWSVNTIADRLSDLGRFVKCSGPTFYGRYNVKTDTALFFHYEKRRKIRGWVLSIYQIPMKRIVSAKQHDRHFTVILKKS